MGDSGSTCLGLNDDQRAIAIFHDVSPADFVSRQVPLIGALEYPDHYDLGMPQYQISTADRKALALVRASPSGIPGDALDEAQVQILNRLIDTYLGRLPGRRQTNTAPAAGGRRRANPLRMGG